jgi:hypothetical protein
MVRDDFWLAVSRFMVDLEAELIPGQNIALVDLFAQRHANRVLTLFGQAYGSLPERIIDLTDDQHTFLDQAISGLTQDGKIIPVRLALFAEMVRERSWTPETLRQVGGTEGVGVTFLEETFSSPQANPKHRLHQKAAQALLNAFLAKSGTRIRGESRSYSELLTASGYAQRPRDFDELCRILDEEVRLISPTDPQELSDGDWRNPAKLDERYYQLTHDYLVPSIREWLARKQRETGRGRAELLLMDLTDSWKKRNALRSEISYYAQPDEIVHVLTHIDPGSLAGDSLSFIIKSARSNRAHVRLLALRRISVVVPLTLLSASGSSG